MMGFFRWLLTGETEAHEFHRKLDDIKREIAETKPQIERLARGGYGNDECQWHKKGSR
jgi:hypothetical protein